MFLVGKRNVAGEAYLAGVDGLRAFAVLSVLIFHLSPEALPGGFVGVDTFFVISGYVVTKSLSHQKSTDIGSFILNFYSRRLRRILPPLLLCLGSNSRCLAKHVNSRNGHECFFWNEQLCSYGR